MVAKEVEEIGKSRQQLPIADVLHHLTVSQRTPRGGESFPVAPKTQEGLFAWFESTVQTGKVVDPTRKEVRAEFAAGAHQILSFAFLTTVIEQQGGSRTLLSPERTLQLYQRLAPNARRVSRPFKCDVLDRIVVPDGVLVNTGEQERVVALCEYSLSEKVGHLKHRLEAFQRVRGWYPDLFANGSFLLMVVPEDSGFATLRKADVKFRKVAYAKQQLMEFTDSLLAELVSPADVRTRMVEQARRYLELVGEGKVTGAWKDWARKHESLVKAYRQSLRRPSTA